MSNNVHFFIDSDLQKQRGTMFAAGPIDSELLKQRGTMYVGQLY